jgi:polyisoprenoid-binding protein YceI
MEMETDMAEMKAGTHSVGPPDGTVVVRTAREGMAARVGHDLVMEIVRWSGTLTIPEGVAEESRVAVTLDTRSLEVREGSGGALPLSAKDIADIKRNALEKVLQVDRHSEVIFESTLLRRAEGGRIEVAGDLTIVGVRRPIRFRADVREEHGATRVTARVPILQSDWGIKPFRAFMGALKVRDEVEVVIDVRVPTGSTRRAAEVVTETVG